MLYLSWPRTGSKGLRVGIGFGKGSSGSTEVIEGRRKSKSESKSKSAMSFAISGVNGIADSTPRNERLVSLAMECTTLSKGMRSHIGLGIILCGTTRTSRFTWIRNDNHSGTTLIAERLIRILLSRFGIFWFLFESGFCDCRKRLENRWRNWEEFKEGSTVKFRHF